MLESGETLDAGLQEFDDREREIRVLMKMYRSMGLPEWVKGARQRFRETKVARRETTIGNVQRALEAYRERKGVQNRLQGAKMSDENSASRDPNATENELRFCHVTKSAVSHIRRGCEHGK